MQKIKKYRTELLTLIVASLTLIFLLEKPIRDYIPIIFAIIGFGRFAILTWKKYYELSDNLIVNHKKLLTENGIDFGQRAGINRVNFFDLISERKKLSISEKEIENDLTELNCLKNMTLISFFGFGILGIISVVLT
ncbi:MAG: hypothetical protein GY739_16860 [Mesoflavibacter sp.]|nr:hypothetical protein [Mesoflavibacter sp.]